MLHRHMKNAVHSIIASLLLTSLLARGMDPSRNV